MAWIYWSSSCVGYIFVIVVPSTMLVVFDKSQCDIYIKSKWISQEQMLLSFFVSLHCVWLSLLFSDLSDISLFSRVNYAIVWLSAELTGITLFRVNLGTLHQKHWCFLACFLFFYLTQDLCQHACLALVCMWLYIMSGAIIIVFRLCL